MYVDLRVPMRVEQTVGDVTVRVEEAPGGLCVWGGIRRVTCEREIGWVERK